MASLAEALFAGFKGRRATSATPSEVSGRSSISPEKRKPSFLEGRFNIGAATDSLFGREVQREQRSRLNEAMIQGGQAEVDKKVQDLVGSGISVDINKLLSTNFTPTRSKKVIDFMKRAGGDIDGDGFISGEEASKILPKIHKDFPNFFPDLLTEGAKDAEVNSTDIKLEMFDTPEGKKLNAQFPEIDVDNIVQQFQDRPQLAESFPKTAEKVQELSKLQQRIDNFGQMKQSLAGDQEEARKVPTVTGEFITDKNVTVGFDDRVGAIAFIQDIDGNTVRVPYDPAIHGEKVGGEAKRDIVTKSDELGRLVRIDQQTGEELPIDRLTNRDTGKSGEELIGEINRNRRRLLITPGQVLAGTGLGANIRSAVNAIVGTLGIPGQVAPITTEARAAIKSLNQFIKAGLTINPKNAITELATIQDFLIDEKSKIIDPDVNITKMINLVNRLESDLIIAQEVVNRPGTPRALLQENIGKVNARLGILSQLPTIAEFKLRGGRIKQMTAEEIKSIPEDTITRGQATAMIRRLNELGVQ